MKNRSLFLLIVISLLLAACAPQVTVTSEATVTSTRTPTATGALTSTSQPASTPVPPPPLTFTPTAVTYSAEQVANMTDTEKIEAAGEMAVDDLAGKAIVGEPRVDGNQVVWEQTEQYTNERGSKDTREVIAGAWDLESGEWIERVTFDELPDLWDAMEDGEQVYFDGELLTMTTITDGPLIDAMNVVMSNGEHLGPNEVMALVDTNGDVKVVEFQYVPNNPATEIMSVVSVETSNGIVIVLQPLTTEGKFVFDGKDPVTKAEISSWFPPLKRYGGNRVLNNAIDTAGSTFVVVTADPANYPGGWAGVRGDVARFTADGSHSFTADERGEADGKPVILLTRLTKPEFLEKNKGFRIFVNWGNGESVGSHLIATLMGGAQDPNQPNNLEKGYIKYSESRFTSLPSKQGLVWRVFQ
jgi:hypothetical protein